MNHAPLQMPEANDTAPRLAGFFAAAFAALMAATSYWSLYRREALTARDDNPRRVFAELAIRRGAILDRSGAPLAATIDGGEPQRVYPLPSAAPATGYASFTYGVSGIEAAYDDVLRGEADAPPYERWRRHVVLYEPQVGRAVQLTIDASVQAAAAAALDEQRGAVVAIDPGTGAMLALASAPIFDPNTLDADWETLIADEAAPLFNRATLGQYPTGTVVLPFILGAAADAGTVRLDRAGLPGAIRSLSPDSLLAALATFGLLSAPDFVLPVSEPPDPSEFDGILDSAMLGAGESALRVSPLQMAVAATALRNDGVPAHPSLVSAVESRDGELLGAATPSPRAPVIAADTAQALDAWVRANGVAAAPGAVGFHETVRLAATGEQFGWFWGYAEDRALAVVVVVEDATGEAALAVAKQVFEAAAPDYQTR